MGSMNKVILIGNLGRDAELRYTQGGTAVATLNLATTETWRDKQSNQKKEQTEWHRVVLWGNMAENLQEYLTKGKQIAVEGKLQTRKWQDKDGHDKYTTEIRADRVTLLGGGGNGQQSSGGGGGTSGIGGGKKNGGGKNTAPPQDDPADSGEPISDDDDVPFAWLLPFILPITATLGAGMLI